MTTLIVSLDEPNGWERFKSLLEEHGCEEAAAAFVWEQIKSSEIGQLDPHTRAKPSKNFLNLQRSLNAELGPPLRSGELAVVWQRSGPANPRNAKITVHRG